jgi:hypothetical protein
MFTVLVAASIARAHPHSSGCTSTAAVPPVATENTNTQLIREPQSAPTVLDRARQLLVDGEALRTGEELEELIVFGFNGARPASGALGGASKAAVMFFLEPCGIETPHIHPRATEFIILVEGFSLQFGSVLENGLVKAGVNQEITGTLNRLEATVFAQGSMHCQFSNACEKAVMVTGFKLDNPGTS